MPRLYCSLLSIIALCVAVVSPQPAIGEPPQEDTAPKQRLEKMQRAIDGFQVASPQIKSAPLLKFASAPLLRYSDQTRNLLDAGVWRLGERGRPTGLAT